MAYSPVSRFLHCWSRIDNAEEKQARSRLNKHSWNQRNSGRGSSRPCPVDGATGQEESMELQTLIDGQAPGSTIQLPSGEFFGQLTIDRPLTIVGHGKSTWIGSHTAPTIRIAVQGVVLKNLMVEVTAGPEFIAIEALPQMSPILENVAVSGAVTGVPAENIRNGAIVEREISTKITFVPPPPISPEGTPNSSTFSSPPLSSVGGFHPQPSSLEESQGPAAPFSLKPHTARTTSQCFSAPASQSPWSTGAIIALAVGLVSATLSISLFVQNRSMGTAESDKIGKYKQQADQERDQKERALARVRELETERDKAITKIRELEQQRDKGPAKASEATRQARPIPGIKNYIQLQKDEEEARRAQSLKQLFEMAEFGNAAAQYRIGIFHSWGTAHVGWRAEAISKDDKEALKWLQEAAKQGHSDATDFLKKWGKSW